MKSKFAYLFYEDHSNGEQAIKELNGFEIKGIKLLVQASRTSRERQDTDQLEQLKNNRVIVSEVDPHSSWQNLKDWARAAGTVSFANVFTKDGKRLGVVEFEQSTVLDDAIQLLEGVPLHGVDLKIEKVS